MTSSPQHGRYLLGERIINLKNGNLKNEDTGVLVQYLQYQALNLDLFDISGNVLSFRGVENLFYTFRLGAPAATFNIKCLNLSNNLIADDGAKYIASHLSNGLHPHLKSLDVSGNQITKTGEGYLVKALLDKATQHMIIYTQKLEQNSKLLPGVGTKEEKIAMYREYLKQGIEKGTNAQGIVVDKSFWGKMAHTKNQFKAASIGIGGFIKCNWQPDDVIESYAQEAFTATISKTLSKT
jgi:hypothetical protein